MECAEGARPSADDFVADDGQADEEDEGEDDGRDGGLEADHAFEDLDGPFHGVWRLAEGEAADGDGDEEHGDVGGSGVPDFSFRIG